MTKRRRTNRTNWNEIAMCIGATVFGLVIIATIAVAQVSSYMAWANQF